MRNFAFSEKVRSEQNLFEDIIIESLKIYGQDIYYLPRDIVNEDTIFGQDVPSSFNSSYRIEMYIDNIEGFEGEGDLFSRFGVEIRDEATFVVSRRRWKQTVDKYDNDITGDRPREGDLIFSRLTNKLFEITHVEHEQPFYQLNNLPVFKLRAQLFEYNDENLDTGVTAIDKIEKDYAYTYLVTLGEGGDVVIGNTATQTLSSGVKITGEVSKYSDTDKILHLIHVGADDGEYHTFVTGINIFVNGLSRTVIAVSEENKISQNEQNDGFSDFGGSDFLDFTESNPFGDPENN
jgi:hypothetical protein